MLEVSGLTSGYGDIVAVRDFSFAIERNNILALLGANGAGKSSTLMSLIGIVSQSAGQIVFKEEDITMLPTYRRISRGMAIVPEGRRIFPDLSVMEILIVGGHVIAKAAMHQSIEQVFEYFPRLSERRNQSAGTLSGGEQQMLALGRALISSPELLLVDELSLGLMPTVVDECYQVLQALKDKGVAIVLVEQNTERALAVADHVCVLEAGNLVWAGPAADAPGNLCMSLDPI